jgi:hypothetical protein
MKTCPLHPCVGAFLLDYCSWTYKFFVLFKVAGNSFQHFPRQILMGHYNHSLSVDATIMGQGYLNLSKIGGGSEPPVQIFF